MTLINDALSVLANDDSIASDSMATDSVASMSLPVENDAAAVANGVAEIALAAAAAATSTGTGTAAATSVGVSGSMTTVNNAAARALRVDRPDHEENLAARRKRKRDSATSPERKRAKTAALPLSPSIKFNAVDSNENPTESSLRVASKQHARVSREENEGSTALAARDLWVQDPSAVNRDAEDDEDEDDASSLDMEGLEDCGGFDDEVDSDDDDDDGDYDEEVDEILRFVMSQTSCPTARRVTRRFRQNALAAVRLFFVDPTGHFSANVRAQKVRQNAGIYAILDKNGKVIKVGSTKNLYKRQSRYEEKGMPASSRFVVILDLDFIDEEASNNLEVVYTEMKQALLDCDDLHPTQKHLYRQLFERGGDLLGAKTTFILGILESGYQEFYNVSNPMEFLMFDKDVCDLWYSDAADRAGTLWEIMPPAIRGAYENGTLNILVISSWAIGGKTVFYPLTPLINRLLAGDRWRNTLHIPVFPDGTTSEEIFSTDFSAEELEAARQRLIDWLTELLTSPIPCVIFLDTNALLFGRNSNCVYDSIHEMLVDVFDLRRHAFGCGKELVPYVDASQLHSIVVNRPFCIAGDSRDYITVARRARRARSAAILLNFVRLLKGRQPLDPYNPNDEFENPINGFIASTCVQVGCHSNGKRSIPLLKDSCTKRDVNPLVENRIAKLINNQASASRFVRKQKKAGTESTQDRRLAVEFSAIVQQAKAGTEESMFQDLVARAQKNVVLAGTATSRIRNVLFEKVLVTSSPLHATLMTLYQAHRDNTGNANAAGNTNARHVSNNALLTRFVQEHAECATRAARSFWIRWKDDNDNVAGTLHEPDLGNQHSVLNALTFSGLEGRTIRRARRGDNAHVTAVKFCHLGLHKVQPIQTCRGYVLVQLLPRKNRKRSEREMEAEYQEFVPRHRPSNTAAGRPFWIRINASVDELYTADYDGTAHVQSFPHGHEIYNGHVWSSLGTLYKRAGRQQEQETFGIRQKKRSNRKGDYIEENGYRLIELTKRKSRV